MNYDTKHFSDQAKSKVDQKDPNPAHRLSHSLKELTLPQGKKVNIRFLEKKVRTGSGILPRRFSSADIYCGSKDIKKVPLKKLRKSVTEGELQHSQQLVQDGLRGLPQVSDTIPSQEMEVYGNNPTHTYIGNGYTTSPITSESKFSNGHVTQDKQSHAGEQTNCITKEKDTFSSVDSQSTNLPTENDVDSLFTVFNWQSCQDDSHQGMEEDMEVDDIEVTNTGSETTVILNNIFSRSSLSKESKEDSIATSLKACSRSAAQNRYDSEDCYYEVEDSEEEPVIINSFPSGIPIPRVVVTDEMDIVVEVIIDPPSLGWDVDEPKMIQSELNESEIDGVDLNMSDLVLGSLMGKVWGDGVSGNDDCSVSVYTDEEESIPCTRL